MSADDSHDHGEHDHGHDEPHEHARGLKGAILEIFAPHSHDAADSLDSALESSERGIRAVKISFVVLLATAAVQVVVIMASGSVALPRRHDPQLQRRAHRGAALHRVSTRATPTDPPLHLRVRTGRRPRGLFVIAMITLSAIIAAAEAVRRLISPQPIDHLGWVAVAGIVGFAGNELVALYRLREGRAIGSAALVADGYHARTDGFTSLAVVVGALGVWAGFQAADPIAGLVISVAILAVLRTAATDVLRRLMRTASTPSSSTASNAKQPVSQASRPCAVSKSAGKDTGSTPTLPSPCRAHSASSRPTK